MNQIRRANTSASGETALERLSDRESLRMVPFIHRTILAEKRRFENYHRNIPQLYYRAALLSWWDQFLEYANQVEKRIRANSAADEQPADIECSENV